MDEKTKLAIADTIATPVAIVFVSLLCLTTMMFFSSWSGEPPTLFFFTLVIIGDIICFGLMCWMDDVYIRNKCKGGRFR